MAAGLGRTRDIAYRHTSVSESDPVESIIADSHAHNDFESGEKIQILFGEAHLEHHDALDLVSQVLANGRPRLGCWGSRNPQVGLDIFDLVVLGLCRLEDLLFDGVVLQNAVVGQKRCEKIWDRGMPTG